MNGYKEFMCLFGDITILDIGQFLLAVGFVVVICVKISKFLIELHDANQLRDEKLEKAYEAAMRLHGYRQQSIGIQSDFITKIEGLYERQDEIIQHIEKMEEDNRKREVNKLRGKLIQYYRYYTNPERNPLGCWSRMESESFWALYSDYENLGGNDYIHSVVQPAMNELEIIDN